jgi:hypothetical protein
MKTNLLTLEIPEDLDRVPEWLEDHLLGRDLRQVATELRVLGGASEDPAVSLSDVLGDKTQEVLQVGLRSLSRAQLRQLLNQPQLLMELQNLVLDEGGEYWMTVPHSDDSAENTKKTWSKLKGALAEDAPKSEIVRPTPTNRKPWLWAGAGWLAATAAAVALLFVRADRVQELEDRVAQQTAELKSLRSDLLAQQRVVPADLPGTDESLVSATADPRDLPDGDPQDLPEI